MKTKRLTKTELIALSSSIINEVNRKIDEHNTNIIKTAAYKKEEKTIRSSQEYNNLMGSVSHIKIIEDSVKGLGIIPSYQTYDDIRDKYIRLKLSEKFKKKSKLGQGWGNTDEKDLLNKLILEQASGKSVYDLQEEYIQKLFNKDEN